MTPGVPPAPAPPAGPAGALGLPSLSEQPDNANARLASTPTRSQSDIDVLITTWASSHPTHSHEVTVFSQFGFVTATEPRAPEGLIFWLRTTTWATRRQPWLEFRSATTPLGSALEDTACMNIFALTRDGSLRAAGG